jgi:hypothetical protein
MDALFNYGMKVSLYSEKKAQIDKVGWHRGCSNISYMPNGIKRDIPKKTYYTLTFTHTYEYSDD